MLNQQTETIATIAVAEGGSLVELTDDDLDVVAGGAHQASGSTFDRHRLSMKGSSFAGPNGAGSTFSMQEEDIHSSSFEMQDDE
jgi:hypothetical protein